MSSVVSDSQINLKCIGDTLWLQSCWPRGVVIGYTFLAVVP